MLPIHNAPLCAAVFAVTKISTDVYRATHHGLGVHWPSALFGAALVAVAGTAGYLAGALVVGGTLPMRATAVIAVVSYFASVSLAHLLSGAVTSLWVFLAGLCAVTFVVTVWIGARWQAPT